MSPIAVWYHIRLYGGEPPIDPDFSIPLLAEQMAALKACGLLAEADEFFIAINGDDADAQVARMFSPCPRTKLIVHGPAANSLLRTVNALRRWAAQHQDWLVCFFHNKGVTHPGDELNRVWRLCLEACVLGQWRQCVADLNAGCDTVGAHWLTKEKYGNSVTFPFWGGMFFWAKASFLASLPELPLDPTCREDWFLPENWIGMGRTPKLKDYADHWPSLKSCGQSAAAP